MLLFKLQSYAARPRIIFMRVRPVPLGLTRTAAPPGDIDARHGPGVGGMHCGFSARACEHVPAADNPLHVPAAEHTQLYECLALLVTRP